MKVSDLIIKFLQSRNINTFFTVSGGGCIHLIDSLRTNNTETICVHHEQAALMAAEGYFRTTNKLAASIVTTGPGGTNTLTGLLGLWLDSIPSIIISGQVPISQLSEGTRCRQIGDQEFDICSVVKPMTKYCKLIKNKNKILQELEKAYNICMSGRPGPVWLDIPLDIQGSIIEDNITFSDPVISQPEVDITNDISKLEELISLSKKPLIIAGNGINLSNTVTDLDKFLKKSNIPIVTGPHSGIDCVDNSLSNYCGRIGILGQLTSNKIVQEADLLICIGTRLPVKMTGYNVKAFSPNSKKVFIDIDINEIKKQTFKIDLSIVCDLRQFFNSIQDKDITTNNREWFSYTTNLRKEQKYFHPKHKELKAYTSFYYFINKASTYFKQIPIVTSNGTAHVVTLQNYIINKNQKLFTNVGCASMGYGLPAAIGSCIGHKDKVICIEGDGSIMMNLQELQTICTYNLPVKLIIINNAGYLSIKLTQESFFDGEEFASGSENGVQLPNFEKLAKSFNLNYFNIKNNNEIDSVLQSSMSDNTPCIIEIFTHPKERHEPKVTHKGIDKDGKIIPGDLTNMYISDTF